MIFHLCVWLKDFYFGGILKSPVTAFFDRYVLQANLFSSSLTLPLILFFHFFLSEWRLLIILCPRLTLTGRKEGFSDAGRIQTFISLQCWILMRWSNRLFAYLYTNCLSAERSSAIRTKAMHYVDNTVDWLYKRNNHNPPHAPFHEFLNVGVYWRKCIWIVGFWRNQLIEYSPRFLAPGTAFVNTLMNILIEFFE